ncbi:WD40-repeat-containing domain protein [Mycena amicta]|nr:WD40-repeat-containing domain protein [Mycena amicta]
MRPVPYTHHPGLASHDGEIYALAVSFAKDALASGGSEGTRIFLTKQFEQLPRPSSAGSRGATCTLLWARRADQPGDVLFAGTQNGFVAIWVVNGNKIDEPLVFQIDNPAEITGLAFDSAASRLALCARNDRIQMYSLSTDLLSGAWAVNCIFDRYIAHYSPQSIFFFGQDKNLLVSGIHNNGPLTILNATTGESIQSWSTGGKNGDAHIHGSLIVLDDPKAGPGLYRWGEGQQKKIRGFEIKPTREEDSRHRDVRFAEGGEVVVCGSDSGTVYVFEVCSGNTLDAVQLGAKSWIQVIATANIGGVPTIFAASSRTDGTSKIFVLKRARRHTIALNHLWFMVQAVMVLVCIAFLYEKLRAATSGFRALAG